MLNLILLLQSPPSTVQQQQDQKGSIEGVVVRIGTGEPIAGAEMKLIRVAGAFEATPEEAKSAGEAIGLPVLPSTTTDRNGRFIFKDVDAGSYRISAARNGYAKLEYGQRVSKGTGTVITVVKRQALKDIVFSLTPAGSVNGNVRDVAGEPLTGFQVLLLRSAYSPTGRRSFQPLGAVRTDDRGTYRFYWVTPGRYYLSAGRGSGAFENSGYRNPNEVDGRPYPTTYYPGALDPSNAQAVEILPGEDLNGIDFVLPQQELYRIRGKVVDATTGKPPHNVELRLAPRQSTGPSNIPAVNPNYNPLNGTFEFRDLAPGSYWIFATPQADLDTPIAPTTAPRTINELFDAVFFSMPTAQAAVDIVSSDVENLVLTPARGVSIAGRVRVDGQELAAIPDFKNIHVMLVPVGPNQYMHLLPPMAPDGGFLLDNIPPGEYRLSNIRSQTSTLRKLCSIR